MKLRLYQLQYAVTHEEHIALQDGTLALKDISAKCITASLTKEFDIVNQAVPHIGETVEDGYWPADEHEREVLSVCFNYADGVCTVGLKPFIMEIDSPLHDDLEHIATLHGWTYLAF